MYYHFETGEPRDSCYLRIAEKDKLDTAIAALSHFTLLGAELKPRRQCIRNFPPPDPPLLDGWLPSHSSNLLSRVIRPPTTMPPKLLSNLIKEQWVFFQNLPMVARLAPEQAAEAFYQQFYSFDVMGMTAPRKNSNGLYGTTCKMLFANPSDARAARKLHQRGTFMGMPGEARIYMGAPEVNKALWDYQLSLPKGTPKEELIEILEAEYKRILARDKDIWRQSNYPTPESAVGVKDS